MKDRNCNNSFTIKNQLQNKEVVRDLNEDEKEKWKEYMEDLCNPKPNPNVNVIGPAGKGHNFRTKDYLQD